MSRNPHIPAILSKRAAIRRRYLLIRLLNMRQLFNAYGEDCARKAMVGAMHSRLMAIGIPEKQIEFANDYIVANLENVSVPDSVSDDLFLERIKALLSYLPIDCGKDRAFMNVQATFGVNASSVESYTGQTCEVTIAKTRKIQGGKYRRDMAIAVNFFHEVRAGLIVLAFQPVVGADSEKEIYSECLLRRPLDEGKDLQSCSEQIHALERLGLIDRLDRSLLWTLIDTLEQVPSIQLGCNLSFQSLRYDGWWRLLQDFLARNYNTAERLTLEIRQPDTAITTDESTRLLLALRLTGCRVVFDDMSAEHSAVDFLSEMGPDVVKIDHVFMTQLPGQQHASHLFRQLITFCKEAGSWVVVKGIESEEELNAAWRVGTRAVQGNFIERPNILPAWLDKPVVLIDSLSTGHRSLTSDGRWPAAG